MDDYKEIKELLMPRRDIKASGALRTKVHRAFGTASRKAGRRNRFLGGISLSAAAALLLLALLPTGMSAKDVLAEAIEALTVSEYIEIVAEIRTRPMENFSYIGLDDNFVEHHIYIVCSDSLLEWRIDKGGRLAASDGKEIFTWLPALKLGWRLDNADSGRILGYMSELLSPRSILESELSACTGSDAADYRVSRTGRDILLTVHAAPGGQFDNPYLLNTSIAESENIRRYVIDAESRKLKSASVSIIDGTHETVVLKITSINFNLCPKSISHLPDDIHFVVTESSLEGIAGLSAEEAASVILNSFAEWDYSVLDKIWPREVSDIVYRDRFLGSKLISIGRAFTSGIGNTAFVPYTLRFKDGTMQRHNIALQRNESGAWIVSGGL